MKKIAIIVLMSLCNLSFGQIIISGMLRNKAAKEPIANVNVMLQRKGSTAISAYTMSDVDGKFVLKISPITDTLLVVVSGMTVKTYSKTILPISQSLIIDLVNEVTNIREVIVKAAPIRRTGDTLNYNVAQFTDQSDRAIGDVLKKMPGIEVSAGGLIKYHGRSINKFYIENMDMLGGRYGIATTNISAKDIATVQVLENHQPINILKNIQFSQDAAINLKLKDNVKGTWNGNIQIGGGYKPAMWNGEAVAMMFARKFQTLNTYKGNNEGDDVSRELKSLYEGGNFGAVAPIGISTPYTPSISQQRYLNNRINSGSINMLWKLAKNYDLTLNATYLNDRQIYDGSSRTSYYLPSDSVLNIDENIHSRFRINQANVELKLLANTDKFYLSNTFNAAGQWSVDDGSVISGKQHINQNAYRPKADVGNKFSLIKNFDKFTLFASTINEFSTSPASLTVSPLLYPELFEAGNYGDLKQDLQISDFRSVTNFGTSFTRGRITHGYNIGLNANLQWLNTALAPTGITPPDSLVNNQYGYTLIPYFTPNFSYKDDVVSVMLMVPVNYQFLTINDNTRNTRLTRNDLLISPRFQFGVTVSPSFKIAANASYNRSVGALGNTYGGYIMNDYRSISNREGIISVNEYQRYSVSLNYGNAIYSLFSTLEGSYWRNNSNLMYDTQFIGTLSQIKSYQIDNMSQGYTLLAKASKRVEAIRTTFSATALYNKSYRDLLRQNKVLNTTNDMLTVSGAFTIRFGTISRLDYDIAWTKSFTKTFGSSESFAPIEVITQKAALMFFPLKSLTLKLQGEHFYNSAIADGSRSMFFVDASISYKTKRFEYMLEGRNLLNAKEFYSATYGDAMGYRYVYVLRPAAVMAKVKFYIK